MIYKIAVCDDSTTDAEYITTLVNTWSAASEKMVHTETFPSAEAFLFRYGEEKDYHMLLLDIEMGGQNGVELARKVREENESVQIVFITGFQIGRAHVCSSDLPVFRILWRKDMRCLPCTI